MNRHARLARAALCALSLSGCAPSLPRAFEEERAAAERAYAAGRYDEAAEHWQAAERAATRRRDQNEAHYRRAAALGRAGRHAEAQALLAELAQKRPKSSRAARAAFDRASIEIEHGNAERGYAELERALARYPRSGVALGALSRIAAHREEKEGVDATLAYLKKLSREAGGDELREQAGFDFARLLEKHGRDREALAAYLDLADRFPYPTGALWDDALFMASLLEEKLGEPRRAILHLERMLKEKEPSSLQGSYERPRYAAARYRVAELCRDRLGDPRRAAKEFHRVWSEHPTSLLRDDALWQAARLERQLGDGEAACKTLSTLADGTPDSRFVPCLRALCPDARPSKAECHPYIVRSLQPNAEE